MVALDYTTRIDPAALKADGIDNVMRYLCYLPVGAWKKIRKSEYDELLNAGISVTLNWEFDERDWLSNRGSQDAREAISQARELGYPPNCTIFASADFDMTRSEWVTTGRQYAKAFAHTCAINGYRAGVYAPWDVLEWVRAEGIMRYFWQAGMSTAWSGHRNAELWPGAHLRQRRHHTVGDIDTDWNDTLIPGWGQARMDLTAANLKQIADAVWQHPLNQGTPGYAGQLAETGAAFDWQASATAATAAQAASDKADQILARLSGVGGLTADDRSALQALTVAVTALNNRLSSP